MDNSNIFYKKIMLLFIVRRSETKSLSLKIEPKKKIIFLFYRYQFDKKRFWLGNTCFNRRQYRHIPAITCTSRNAGRVIHVHISCYEYMLQNTFIINDISCIKITATALLYQYYFHCYPSIDRSNFFVSRTVILTSGL